jgi:hypothetical protein
MGTCTRCAGLAKALRSAEKQNLDHVKRTDALETLLRELLDHGEFAPAVLELGQAALARLTGRPA